MSKNIASQGDLKNAMNSLASEEFRMAMAQCEKILILHNQNTSALEIYVRAAAASNSYEPAYQFLKKLITKKKDPSSLHFFLGMLLALSGFRKIEITNIYAALGDFNKEKTKQEACDILLKFESTKKIVRSEAYKNEPFFDIMVDAIFTALRSVSFSEWEKQLFYSQLYKSAGKTFFATRLMQIASSSKLIFSRKNGDFLQSRIIKPTPDPSADFLVENDWIYLIAPVISPRASKLSRALRKKGKKVRLYTRRVIGLLSQSEDHFDEIYYADCYIDLCQEIHQKKPYAVHALVNLDDGFAEAITAFLCNPDRFVLDVYDMADVSLSPISRWKAGSKRRENFSNFHYIQRFLIDYSPGICSRCLFPKLLRSNIPKIRQLQIRSFLPEFGWGTIPNKPKLSQSDDMLHVVHGSTFWPELSKNSKWACMYWLGEKAENLGIHFHLYPFHTGEQDLSEYQNLAERTPNFHYHDPLPYDEWIDTIQIYDVGLFHIHPYEDMTEGELPRMIGTRGSWANKFGDYTDAELYMVLSWKQTLLGFYAKRYGIGEQVEPDKFYTKEFWDNVKYKILRKGIDFSKAREDLSITEKGDNLISLYEKIRLNGLHKEKFTLDLKNTDV